MREVESLTSVLLVSSCPHSLLGLILCPLDLDNPLLPGPGVRSETLSQQVEISMICMGSLSSVTGCLLPVLC